MIKKNFLAAKSKKHWRGQFWAQSRTTKNRLKNNVLNNNFKWTLHHFLPTEFCMTVLNKESRRFNQSSFDNLYSFKRGLMSIFECPSSFFTHWILHDRNKESRRFHQSSCTHFFERGLMAIFEMDLFRETAHQCCWLPLWPLICYKMRLNEWFVLFLLQRRFI